MSTGRRVSGGASGGASYQSQVIHESQEKFNSRVQSLIDAGATHFIESTGDALFNLASNQMLTDDELVDTWLAGLTDITKQNAVTYFNEQTKDYQRMAWNTLPDETKTMFLQAGYKLPKKDVLNWWNPGDWHQFKQQGYGNAPFGGIWKPIAYGLALTGGTATEGVQKAWRGLEAASNVSMRTARGVVAENRERDSMGMPTIGGLPMPTANALVSPPPIVGAVKNWENTEFANASFSKESIIEAKEAVKDREEYDILFSTFRHGDVAEGIFKYYFELNGGDQQDAMRKMQAFLASGSLESDGWVTASAALLRGRLNPGVYASERWEDIVRSTPEYFGGLRNVKDRYGNPASMEQASGFWRKGQTITMLTAEIAGAITFDPLNPIGGVVFAALKARPFVQGARYYSQTASVYKSAAGLKALDEAKLALKTGTDVAEAGSKSRLTRGAFNSKDQSAGAIRGRMKEWAEKPVDFDNVHVVDADVQKISQGDKWFAKSSWWRKEQLRGINNKIEQINDAFRRFDEYELNEMTRAAGGRHNFHLSDPLTELGLQDKRFRDIMPQMLAYHKNAKNTPLLDIDDPLGIAMARPGLDEYDGWWNFLMEEQGTGLSTLMTRLGGRDPDRLLLPRLSWASKLRLRASLGQRSFMKASDNPTVIAGDIFAEHTAGWLASRDSMITNRILGEIAADPTFSLRAKSLTVDEIGQALTQPERFTRESISAKNVLDIGSMNKITKLAEDFKGSVIKDLKKVYDEVIVGGADLQSLKYNKRKNPDGIPVEVIDILEDNLPHIDNYFRMSFDNFGPLQFDDAGNVVANLSSKVFFRQGRQFAENKRRGLLGTPGGMDQEQLLRIPSEITRTTNKTWSELADNGIDVGKMKRNLNDAGLDTPQKLMNALEKTNLKKVANDIKAPIRELKKFIKDELHIAYAENKFYDVAGKLNDAGIALVYQTAYRSAMIPEKLFKMTPKAKYLDVTDDATAISEFKALADMGVLANVPRKVIDTYISQFAMGNEAMRKDVVYRFLTDLAGRAGVFTHGGPKAEKIFRELASGSDMVYSNISNDIFHSSHGIMSRAIFPGQAHSAQLSKLNVIPDWREIGYLSQRLGIIRSLGFRLGVAELDKVISSTWRRGVLFKLGLAPRNAADELITALFRHGSGIAVNPKLAKQALNQAPVRDIYGNMLSLTRDSMVPVREGTEKLVELANVSDVAVQRSAMLTPWNFMYRTLLDGFKIGNKATARKAEQVARNTHKANWNKMTPFEKRQAIDTEMETLYEGRNLISQGALRLQYFGENLSAKLAARMRFDDGSIPNKLIGSKAELGTKLLKGRGINNERMVETASLAMGNRLTMESIVEGLYKSHSKYYETANPNYLDDLLKGGANPKARESILHHVELDYTGADLQWLSEGSEMWSNLEGVAQAINHISETPSAVVAAEQLAHFVDDTTGGFFRTIVARHENVSNNIGATFKVKELIEDNELIRLLQEAYVKAPTFAKNEWREWNTFVDRLISQARYISNNNPIVDDLFQTILKPSSTSSKIETEALAFLINRKIDKSSLLAGNSLDAVASRQLRASVDQLQTVEGSDQLMSLVHANGVDPIVGRTMLPLNNNIEIGLYFPQVNGDVALNLSYLFNTPKGQLADEMRDALQQFLTTELGDSAEAARVIRNLDPTNNPYGSTLPASWINSVLENGAERLAELVRNNPATVSQFIPTASVSGVQSKVVPLITGSHMPMEVEKIQRALVRWNNWLRTGGGINDVPSLVSRALPTSGELPLVRRVFGKAEYEAQFGFGRRFGTNEAWGVRRAQNGPDIGRPPTVLLRGDNWGSKKGVPSGWQQEMVDDIPTGNWIMGDKAAVSRREWIEEEIITIADALYSLPDGSVVRYPYSPTVRMQSPDFDEFGEVVDRMIDLINDSKTQTKRTIGELERDIWEIVGDAPASGLTRVPGGEAGRDFIGAVGEGPRNSFGYRRIFNDFKEDDLVSKSLVKDTFGDVAEYPGSKILDPFNINYSEVQFSQDSIGLINWKIKQMMDVGDVDDIPDYLLQAYYESASNPNLAGAYYTSRDDILRHFDLSIDGIDRQAFFAWRNEQVKNALASTDSVWPFYRSPEGKNWVDTIMNNPDPKDFPLAFQQTAQEAMDLGRDIDLSAQVAGKTRTARLVHSNLRVFPESEQAGTFWSWDQTKGTSITPSDIGGFHKGMKFVSVNPLSLSGNFLEEAVDGISRINIYKHKRTGVERAVREGMEKTTPQFNLQDYKMIGSQDLSKYDMYNAAELVSNKMINEINHLFTTSGRTAGKLENHQSLLLELTDPPDGLFDLDRIRQVANKDKLPTNVLARTPVVPPTSRWEMTKDFFSDTTRSFFDGAVHPMIKSIIREPMYMFYLDKTLWGPGLAMKTAYRHSPNAFALLQKRLKTKIPARWLNASADAEDGSKILKGKQIDELNDGFLQYNIPDFDKFTTHIFNSRVMADDMPAMFAHLVDDWMAGVKSKDILLDEMFDLTAKINIEINPFAPPRFVDFNLKNKQVERAFNAGAEFEWSGGVFHRAFPGYEGQFFYLKQTLGEVEFNKVTRQFAEYLAHKQIRHNKWIDGSMERAANITAEYVDNHALRSQFQEMVGSAIPFHTAHFQFLQRWVKTLEQNPMALVQLNWSLFAARQAGFLYEDERTGEARLKVPGSEMFSQFVFETAAKFPIVGGYLGDNVGVVADGMSFNASYVVPGYDLETIGDFSFGPLLSIPIISAARFLDPAIRDADLGFGNNLVSQHGYGNDSIEIWLDGFMPTTLTRPFETIMAILFDTDITGRFAKAQMDAITMLGLHGTLGTQKDITDPIQQALIDEQYYAGITHIAKLKMLLDTITWEVVGSSPQGITLTQDPGWVWNEKFQFALDTGMAHEDAFEFMFSEYQKEFETEFYADNPRATQEEFNAEWMIELTKISAFTVGKTSRASIAETPLTVGAFNWLADGNMDWVADIPMAGAWFIPRGSTPEETEYATEARDIALLTELRQEKVPEELLITLSANAAARGYFVMYDDHRNKLAEWRKARNEGHYNYVNPGEDWRITILNEMNRWDLAKEAYLNHHPLFREQLTGTGSKNKRETTYEQIHILLANRDLVPEDTPNREDIFNGLELYYNLNNRLKMHENDLTQLGEEARNRIKRSYYETFQSYMKDKPWLNTMFYNLFVPFLTESWIINYDVGNLDYGEAA